MRYSYLSKILTLKLSDSCKEMFREIAILYHEKRQYLAVHFSFSIPFYTKISSYISFSFSIPVGW